MTTPGEWAELGRWEDLSTHLIYTPPGPIDIPPAMVGEMQRRDFVESLARPRGRYVIVPPSPAGRIERRQEREERVMTDTITDSNGRTWSVGDRAIAPAGITTSLGGSVYFGHKTEVEIVRISRSGDVDVRGRASNGDIKTQTVAPEQLVIPGQLDIEDKLDSGHVFIDPNGNFAYPGDKVYVSPDAMYSESVRSSVRNTERYIASADENWVHFPEGQPKVKNIPGHVMVVPQVGDTVEVEGEGEPMVARTARSGQTLMGSVIYAPASLGAGTAGKIAPVSSVSITKRADLLRARESDPGNVEGARRAVLTRNAKRKFADQLSIELAEIARSLNLCADYERVAKRSDWLLGRDEVDELLARESGTGAKGLDLPEPEVGTVFIGNRREAGNYTFTVIARTGTGQNDWTNPADGEYMSWGEVLERFVNLKVVSSDPGGESITLLKETECDLTPWWTSEPPEEHVGEPKDRYSMWRHPSGGIYLRIGPNTSRRRWIKVRNLEKLFEVLSNGYVGESSWESLGFDSRTKLTRLIVEPSTQVEIDNNVKRHRDRY